ncbi:MAG TPA: EF-hand domain-containing protein [Steroidobacteraceae bacterium]|jgi:hypothetical protein|nr:EF-hand domain-containing protein [Steroidobacteraceae bacterium]
MFKFSFLPLFLAITLAAAADPAPAPAPAAKAPESQARAADPAFQALDRNDDHQISRTEAGVDRHLADDFAYIDTDGDGYISPAEYAARTRT